MQIRGQVLSAQLMQDYKDRCRLHHESKYKEQIDWCIEQINNLTEKEWLALLNFSKRKFNYYTNSELAWNLIYNTSTYYAWLKAVTGKSEPETEKILKAYGQDKYPFVLDKQSKIDLGFEVTVPPEVEGQMYAAQKPDKATTDLPTHLKPQEVTTKITEKDLVIEEIDKKIAKHEQTGNKGALAGWQRMKGYLVTGLGNFDDLLKEAESKKHNNPKLWDRVIYQLKAKKKVTPSTSPSTTTQKQTINASERAKDAKMVAEQRFPSKSPLDQVKEAIKKWSELHGYSNDAARILVAERDALLGHGNATVTGSLKLVEWLENLYNINLIETRKRRNLAGVDK